MERMVALSHQVAGIALLLDAAELGSQGLWCVHKTACHHAASVPALPLPRRAPPMRRVAGAQPVCSTLTCEKCCLLHLWTSHAFELKGLGGCLNRVGWPFSNGQPTILKTPTKSFNNCIFGSTKAPVLVGVPTTLTKACRTAAKYQRRYCQWKAFCRQPLTLAVGVSPAPNPGVLKGTSVSFMMHLAASCIPGREMRATRNRLEVGPYSVGAHWLRLVSSGNLSLKDQNAKSLGLICCSLVVAMSEAHTLPHRAGTPGLGVLQMDMLQPVTMLAGQHCLCMPSLWSPGCSTSKQGTLHPGLQVIGTGC